MSFEGFALSKKLTSALDKLGYKEPSPVQYAVIPKVLRGGNVMCQSATGTGKTHAYLVPLLEKTDMSLNRVQSLVIAPTRELARQIFVFANEFGRFFPSFKVRLYTSESDVSQNEEGSSIPPQMIIGTPGRLKELLCDRHIFSLQSLRTIVLDEADMLMDMGFFDDIEEIFRMGEPRQTLVFSATLKQNLKDEVRKFVPNDFEFEGEEKQTPNKLRHHLIDIKHKGELNALLSFLKIKNPYLCIVFCSTVEKVNSIHKGLKENGIEAIYFSGSLDDRSRKRALREIQANKCSVIVSSDLLARGMDIPDVSDVISIDLPSDMEFYHHRAGRTARFGKEGDSWVFYNADNVKGALALENEGIKFDYFILKDDCLKEDPLGLKGKQRPIKKKELPEEERKEIAIAKAKSRPKHVEPMHKKKRQFAIEAVKRKYRRKAIQKSVNKSIARSKSKGN